MKAKGKRDARNQYFKISLNYYYYFFVLNLFCQGTSPVTLIYFTEFREKEGEISDGVTALRLGTRVRYFSYLRR